MRYTSQEPLTEEQARQLFALNDIENERARLAEQGDYDAAKEAHAKRDQLTEQLQEDGITVEW